MFGARRIPDLGGGGIVTLPDFLRVLDRGIEADIRIAVLRRPDDRFVTDDARNPDARVRLLQRQRPGVHDALMEVLALPPERTRHGPGLHDQVVRFLEPFAVEGGVGVGRQLFLPAAAHEPGHQAALGDHVDHRQLFRQPDRIVVQRQRIAQQHDLHPLRHTGEQGRENIRLRLHAERGVVMLVQHDAVDTHFLGVDVVFEEFVIQPAAVDGIEMLVRHQQGGVTDLQPRLGRVILHRLLREVHQMHGRAPRLKR